MSNPPFEVGSTKIVLLFKETWDHTCPGWDAHPASSPAVRAMVV